MPAAPSDPTDRVPDSRPERAGRGSGTGRPRSLRPWLVSDSARYVVATLITAVLAAAYGSLVQATGPDRGISLIFIASVYFGSWSVYSLLYAGLTWAVLRRADGDELAEWLSEDRQGRRRRRRAEWLAGSGGPLGATSFCALAIAAVISASLLPELRGNPVIVALAVSVVATSWLLIVVVYAVHYARENTFRGGLEFRGVDDDGPPRLADYAYLAVQIGTAYNGADVTATSRAMRRTITVHAVVAFVYNTVLIALLVSLLITVTS